MELNLTNSIILFLCIITLSCIFLSSNNKNTNKAIVIGSGLAGSAAALTILESGGSVVMMEKQDYTGGNSSKASSGINGSYTKTQQSLNIKDLRSIKDTENTEDTEQANSEILDSEYSEDKGKTMVFNIVKMLDYLDTNKYFDGIIQVSNHIDTLQEYGQIHISHFLQFVSIYFLTRYLLIMPFRAFLDQQDSPHANPQFLLSQQRKMVLNLYL